MPIVTLVNEGKTLEVAEGANLRKVLLKNGLSPYVGKDRLLNCLGHGLCGTCRVEIVDGKNAPAMSALEEASLPGLVPFYARKVEKNVRLACRIPVTKDLSLKMHPQVSIDWQATKERLGLLAIWTVFGGTFLFVLIRLLVDIASGR